MSLNQRRHSQALETLYLPDRVILTSSWWSQTGSNRRPHACKARALPTELWPPFEEEPLKLRACHRPVRPRYHTRSVVGPGRLELPTSRLSGVCSNQLSYRPLKRLVPGPGPGTRDRTTALRTAGVFCGKRNEDGDTPHLCSVYDEPIEPREVLEAHP